jgi:hypothetical protein
MATESGTRRDDLSLPLAGLFCLTLVGGVLTLSFLPESRVILFYVEGRCVLLNKRVAEYRPGDDSYRPDFLIRYTVSGREYRRWTYDAVRASTAFRWPNERILDRFTVGAAYPCWYDPADPSQVVLVWGYSWWTCGVMLAFVVLLLLTGKGFLSRLRGAPCAAAGARGVERRGPSGTSCAAHRGSQERRAGPGQLCDSVTSGDQVGPQVTGTRAPPAPVRRGRQQVRRPSHFSVGDGRTRLRIRFRWLWHRFVGPAGMCLAWNSFVVAWYWNALRNGGPFMWPAVIITLPHGAVGLLLVYATLAGLLNRTVIEVTSESVTVWQGPVPWWGNRRLSVAGLERLSCHQDADSAEHGRRHGYSVQALTKGAGQVDLVTDLDSAEALFIKQELERWLKMDGAGVGRAVQSPGAR